MQPPSPPAKRTPSIYDLREDVRSALIVVDMQRDWFSGSDLVRTAFPQLPGNVADLLAVFRAAETPVVHVRAKYDCPVRSSHIGYFKQLNPEKPSTVSLEPEPCAQELPGELVVFKPTFDGFHNTELHAELKRLDVRRVYVCGLVTAACVLNTCFGAFRHGYEVVLVADCTADRSRAQHDSIIAIYNGYTFIAAGLPEIESFLRAPRSAALADEAAASAQPLRSSPTRHAARAARADGASACALGRERSERALDEAGAGPEARLRADWALSAASSLPALSPDLRANVDNPHAPAAAAAAAVCTSQRRALLAGLSGLACIVHLLAVSVEAVAAGHGCDERLQAPPPVGRDATALRASWSRAAAAAPARCVALV